MIYEQTRQILTDPERVQRDIIRRRRELARHPRFRGMRDVLARLPEEAVPGEQFHRMVDESPALEKIVLAVNRPALLVSHDSFEVPIDDVWNARLNAARDAVERAIRAVGRIELREPARSGHIGTAWLVATDVVVTNRHVAREFARHRNGRAVFRTSWLGVRYRPQVDFREEYRDPRDPLEFDVIDVVHLADDDETEPDVALLRIRAAGQPLPHPVPISAAELSVRDPVATIGYPAFDYGELDRAAMVEVFSGIFDVKRVSPGEVLVPPQRDEWFFRHDCTTLSGSSGSVVLSLETGEAVGLHFSGTSGSHNYAVSAQALGRVLEGVRVWTGRPGPLRGKPPEEELEEERGASPDAYADRDGYDTAFLGDDCPVPRPSVVAERKEEVAPRTDVDGDELKYRHFSIVVNGKRRFPMITLANIEGTSLRRVPGTVSWRFDPRLAREHQAGNAVYRNNNLDRGHMVRRLDPVWGTEEEARQANDDTYHYTNACPQDHTFNDQVWGDLEDHILDSAPDDLRLCVLTGPVLAEDDPPYRGILIPRSFWKVVAWRREGKLRVAAFLLTQEDYLGNLEFNPYQFGTVQVTLAELGEGAGLDFGPLVAADVLADLEATRPRFTLRAAEDLQM